MYTPYYFPKAGADIMCSQLIIMVVASKTFKLRLQSH